MTTTLADRVKERMAALDITNAQLAQACGVKPPTSFNWASGKTKKIKGEPLLLAAHLFGVTPDWLATGKGSKYPSDSAYPTAQERRAVYHIGPQADKLSIELLALFGQLDANGKAEFMGYTRGFVAGRRPHPNGTASDFADKKTGVV